jgi:hypothetical protein
MKIAFLTPLGPGHEHKRDVCVGSSEIAFRHDRGPFTEMHHFVLDDTKAYYGRAAGRNRLLRMARGWGADWIMFVDSTDVVHPRALRRMAEVLERDPDVQTIMGCLSLWFSPKDCVKHGIDAPNGHLYRAEADISPLTWEELIEHGNVGTVGTHSAVRMDLAWKLGFRPDLPAAEYFEFTHACFASAPYAKIPHPLIVVDRSTNHSSKDDDPTVNHGSALNESIQAITSVWGMRGRTPFSYHELEERWHVRQFRTQDFETEMTMLDIAMDEHVQMREF